MSWIVAVLGAGVGLIFGVAIGYAFCFYEYLSVFSSFMGRDVTMAEMDLIIKERGEKEHHE